ncbi:delta(24)-sterol reductase [Artemisia annua]|uniref:Delta(24)-sterol reductase n=1 Tax=Artemisia annua TaxID=35608 RepID=A0A2U1PUL9_ARTAN|nr:delta(24)-sterol reductase [Artemisia annua]
MNSIVRPKRKKVWVDYLVQFRWILIIFIVLPMSLTLYLFYYLGELMSNRRSYKQRQKEHDENIPKTIKRLKKRNPSKHGLICTARKPWVTVGMRNVDYKRARHFQVDLSTFCNILEIDHERMVTKCEPLVTMGQLTRVTVPMNLALAVVPELDDLTVGGLINGSGLEGSSHLLSVLQKITSMKYSDLFYAIPWSQGTIGLLTCAEIKLITIKEYMKLTYTPVKGNITDLARGYIDSFAPQFGDVDDKKVPDFVETIIYNPNEAVCMTGKYASKEEAKRNQTKINSIGWWFKPWFYQHAQTALKKGEFAEYIPIREYYHRHTWSYFWEAKLLLPFADQWWFRFLLGWMMPPKIHILKATQVESIQNYYHDMHVLQDLLVPLYKVSDALEWAHHEMELEVAQSLFLIYTAKLRLKFEVPIILDSLSYNFTFVTFKTGISHLGLSRLYKHPYKTMVYPEPGFEQQQRRGDTAYAQMYTDIGLYYAPGPVLRGEVFDGSNAVSRMEQWLIENHGFGTQYAVSELSEKNFWKMFDGELYDKCRRKYGAIGNFMTVYYKSKKGRKTEKEVHEAENVSVETP